MPYTDPTGRVWPDVQTDAAGNRLILDPFASAASNRAKYRYDPAQQQAWAQQYGFAEAPEEAPKPPSAWENLAMIVGTQAALQGGNALGRGIGDAVGGLFSSPSVPESAAEATASTGGFFSNLWGGGGSGGGGAGGSVVEAPVGMSASRVAPPAPAMGAVPGIVPIAMAAQAAYSINSAKDFADGKELSWDQKLLNAPLTGGLSLFSDQIQDVFGMGPSTQEIQAKNTDRLFGMAPEDAQWQSYLEGARAQNIAGGPVDPSNPFAGGKYATWDDYVAGGLEAGDLTGVLGNLETFGPGWSSLGFDQQRDITQRLIDDGQYYSSKGEVLLRDPSRAMDIYQSALAPVPEDTLTQLERERRELAAKMASLAG